MQVRNTVIMALILVLLAGFVYFYEIRGREAREEAERREELLVVFEPEDVTRLSVDGTDGTVAAEKTEDGWRIVEPRELPADDAALDGLVDDLSRATKDRLIAEAAEDLSTYGLTEPEARVTVTLEDGSELSVAVGKDTPVGANLYATTGTGEVYSAPRALRGQIAKSLLDLRDRSILAFAEDEVERVELRRAALKARLEREAGDGEDDEAGWRATEPFAGRADEDLVSDLLDALGNEEVEAFVFEGEGAAERLADWGLDEPAMEVTVWTAEDASQRLLIGSESEEPAGHHAMRAGGDAIFVVPDAVVDALPTTVDTLRNRDVLDIPRSRVSAMEFRQGDDVIAVERDDADWRITAPRELGADSSRVSQLLSTLVDLRADGFATPDAAQGLDAPGLSVAITVGGADEDAATETVRIDVGGATTVTPEDADEDAEPEPARYVSVAGDPTIYVVTDEELDDLRVDLFDLRDKTLVEFSQPDLTELRVSVAGDADYRLVKDGEEWGLAEPSGASLEDGELVSDLLWDLNYLRMEGIASEDDGMDPSGYGLQPPAYRVIARIGEEVAAEIAIGGAAPGDDEGGRVYVQVEGLAGVYEVYAGLRDSLEALVDGIRSP